VLYGLSFVVKVVEDDVVQRMVHAPVPISRWCGSLNVKQCQIRQDKLIIREIAIANRFEND
jgi:hypothetical protein